MRMNSHNLIQDVSTHWNSTFYMIEQLVEQRWPITAVLSDNSVTKLSDRYLDLKSEQWEILSAFKELLYPLQVATTYSSAKYNVSTSALYPILYGLTRKLIESEDDLPCIKECKKTISAEIKRRWNLDSVSKIGISEILKTGPPIACIIDPCFKQCKFLGVEKQILTRLACDEKDRQDSQRTETLQTESTQTLLANLAVKIQ